VLGRPGPRRPAGTLGNRGRHPRFSEALPARVRRCFGRTPAGPGRWLGRGVAQAGQRETGTRPLTPAAAAALASLAGALPERPLLERRLRYCRHYARRRREALLPLETQAAAGARPCPWCAPPCPPTPAVPTRPPPPPVCPAPPAGPLSWPGTATAGWGHLPARPAP